jgi:hypothetical protein
MNAPSDDELAKIQQRVASYPTDLQLRFELGAALYARREYAVALRELHRAMDSPPVRLRAMTLIAEIFDARGMKDMAAEMREQLSRESGDEGDSGSASVPVPKRPRPPLDSSSAENPPDYLDSAK